MLASAELVETVAELLAGRRRVPVVVDPVGVSKHGDPLLAAEALDAVRTRLLPLRHRRHPEPRRGRPSSPACGSSREDGMRRGRRRGAGLRAALGAGQGRPSARRRRSDLLTDGTEEHWLRAPRYDNRHTHGTGCTLASAIAAQLAQGPTVPDGGGRGQGVRHRRDRRRLPARRRHRPGRPRLASRPVRARA